MTRRVSASQRRGCTHGLRALLCAVGLTISALAVYASAASAESPKAAWTITSLPQPTNFPTANLPRCSESEPGLCDRYSLIIHNVGGAASSGELVVRDELPAAVAALRLKTRGGLTCSPAAGTFTCTDANSVPAGGTLLVTVAVSLQDPSAHDLFNHATVEETSGAEPVTATSHNIVSDATPAFAPLEFAMIPHDAAGGTDVQAGAHPDSVTVRMFFPTVLNGVTEEMSPVEGVKDMVVDLPAGFSGNPMATARCPQSALAGIEFATGCPAGSQVGTLVLDTGNAFGIGPNAEPRGFPVYNIAPESGSPAELGFNYQGNAVFLYPNLAPGAGYSLRVIVPGIARGIEVDGAELTLWGTPGAASHDAARQFPNTEEAGAVSSSGATAFLTNPTACTEMPSRTTLRADSWEHPGKFAEASAVMYPTVSGCGALEFDPRLVFAPETTQADATSGSQLDVEVPQATPEAPLDATPTVRNTTVVLPAGMSLSPAAATGLVACDAGPAGIGLGAEEPAFGTVAGSGLTRPEAGHCPGGSAIGTVEIETPLLPDVLMGHLFVATPECGGVGQTACTNADAESGRLFRLYLEARGDGVVIKVAGTVSADPTTGRLTASFPNTPQQPFSLLRVHLNGGSTAPLATPPACGPATTTSGLAPWADEAAQAVLRTSAFEVDWNGAGAPCPQPEPFAPSFSGGGTIPLAAANTNFVVSFGRSDRNQYLGRTIVKTPAGLLGDIASVDRCEEPQASRGECSAGSQIGSVAAAAGAGSNPLWEKGGVYLTGPYKGAPFGLSIVVPAKAGPFNLGNVIVRAAIHIDPSTAALSVESDDLPTIVDGIPLRIQAIVVTIDRAGFMLNPTNCQQQQLRATLRSVQAAEVQLSSPFAVGGCKGLGFSPKLSAKTSAHTSRSFGAPFQVSVAATPGQANIRQVKVDLPSKLPSRLTTLQKACLAATFEQNRPGCPAASIVGSAVAHTPLLRAQLAGPAYLVSHGSAKFPDLVIVLAGEGVLLELVGQTTISKGVTSSSFKALPDAPMTSFTLTLPQGPHSVLAGFGNLCARPLQMPTAITGANGAVLHSLTRIGVTGCPHPGHRKRERRHRRKR